MIFEQPPFLKKNKEMKDMINRKKRREGIGLEDKISFHRNPRAEGQSPSARQVSVELVEEELELIGSDELGNSNDDYRFLEFLDNKRSKNTPPIPKEEFIVLKQRANKKFAQLGLPKQVLAEFIGHMVYRDSDYQSEPGNFNTFDPDSGKWYQSPRTKSVFDFEEYNPWRIRPNSQKDSFHLDIWFNVWKGREVVMECKQSFHFQYQHQLNKIIDDLNKIIKVGKIIPVRWNSYKGAFRINFNPNNSLLKRF